MELNEQEQLRRLGKKLAKADARLATVSRDDLDALTKEILQRLYTERQLRGKPAGIRTAILIVMGTYVFIAASMSVNSNMTDPSRIIGQVITGVGFLGAGVMLARDGMVLGVTSAATIWVLAAIGVCIGIGQDLVAIKLSVLVVIVLVGIDILENSSSAMRRGVHRTARHARVGQHAFARARHVGAVLDCAHAVLVDALEQLAIPLQHLGAGVAVARHNLRPGDQTPVYVIRQGAHP